MPNVNRVRCVRCGGHRDEVGLLSWRGYCAVCGPLLLTEAALQIRAKQGPVHHKRMLGYAKMLQRSMLDDERASA